MLTPKHPLLSFIAIAALLIGPLTAASKPSFASDASLPLAGHVSRTASLAPIADPIKDAFLGCSKVLTFDNDALGFRTASTRDNRAVVYGPFNVLYHNNHDASFR